MEDGLSLTLHTEHRIRCRTDSNRWVDDRMGKKINQWLDEGMKELRDGGMDGCTGT